MFTQFQIVQSEALKLSPQEREKLAEQLMLSLQDSADSSVEEKWLDAAEERFQAYKEGKSEVFEVREVIESLRKKLQ